MKKIVITGATSFLGKNTISYLVSRGYFIYALVRKDSPNIKNVLNHKNVRLVEFCFSDILNLTNVIYDVDCFLHYAWDSSKGRDDIKSQQKNIDNSLKALELCKRISCKKFIFSGSQAEYGFVNGEIDETTECNPFSEYGKAKYKFGQIGEQFAEKNHIDFIHLRIFSIYGYGDRVGTLIDYFLSSFLKRKKAILGPCNQKWNYLYITDFLKIIEKFISMEIHTTIVNIASKDTRNMRDFIEEMNKSIGGTVEYVYENCENKKLLSLEPNISKLLNLIKDMKFTSFTNGISETYLKYLRG